MLTTSARLHLFTLLSAFSDCQPSSSPFTLIEIVSSHLRSHGHTTDHASGGVTVLGQAILMIILWLVTIRAQLILYFATSNCLFLLLRSFFGSSRFISVGSLFETIWGGCPAFVASPPPEVRVRECLFFPAFYVYSSSF